MPKANARRLGETLLILAIIAVLGGVWLQGTERYTAQAHELQAQQQMYSIAKALRAYHFEHGSYPSVVNNQRFCEPFRMYQGQLCLYQLIGNYITLESLNFSNVVYIYTITPEHVILAVDIPVEQDTPMSNQCTIGEVQFWCLTLPR